MELQLSRQQQTPSQPMHEKSRLQTIEEKVKHVQETLTERFPTQYRHMLAVVCSTKWRLQSRHVLDAAAALKKARIELGAFDYRVKEQAELLTRYLLELDDVLSYGDVAIKSARKALVVFIQQQLLPQADGWKQRSAKLKRFGEIALSRVHQPTSEDSTMVGALSDAESDDLHVKTLFLRESDDESRKGGEKENKVEEQEEEDDVEEQEEEDDSEDEEEDDVEEQEEEDDSGDEEEEDDEMDESAASAANVQMDESSEEAPVPSPPSSLHLESAAPASPSREIAVESLPVWRPYYQLQRRQDGVYLIARLNNIDPRNVRVQWNEHSGVLRVSGFRLPTQKDVVMSRLSGTPTYGRFEITEQFPRNMLNMEEATQQISETGILQIRMPFYVARHPLRYRPASFYQPQDCFVW